MNFALVKETEIAGVLIWKSIEDINQIYIPKNGEYVFGQIISDYIFTSLYQAAQGIERLQKVAIELLSYNKTDENEKQRTLELLLSHNHPAMYDYIVQRSGARLDTNCKKLINILSEFYAKARYNRYSFSKNDLLELELFQDFGDTISAENYDQQLKHLYGKTLGKIAQGLYDIIEDISTKLCVYVYELNSQSVASFVLNKYYGEDIYETLKRVERSKRELIWYLMNKGKELSSVELGKDICPLPFDCLNIDECIQSLVTNENSCLSLHNFVDEEYDNMVSEDKQKWHKHIEAIDALVGNPNVNFDEFEL